MIAALPPRASSGQTLTTANPWTVALPTGTASGAVETYSYAFQPDGVLYSGPRVCDLPPPAPRNRRERRALAARLRSSRRPGRARW